MKAKHFGLIGIATLMLTGCNGNMPAGKDLKDLQNATTEDSVANLLGQGQSMGYWQAAAQDSTLKTDKGREAYIKGFLKAMDIVSEDEAYNAGLRSGLDAALNLKAINKNYELNLNKDVYLQGYSLGMASDSAVNKEQLQTVMGNIGQRLEKQKADRDAKKADEALSARVKKDGLKRNGDYAYKILNQGSGALLENGDMVLVDISMTDASGKQIMPSQGNMPIEIGGSGTTSISKQYAYGSLARCQGNCCSTTLNIGNEKQQSFRYG